MAKVLSLEDLLTQEETSGTRYAVVPYAGNEVQIGSLSSADMIEWLEANEDKAKRREAGLHLIVKALVFGGTRSGEGADLKISGGTRVPEEGREALLASFRKKDASENGNLVKAILDINGITKKAAEIKNDLGETTTDASPTN